MHTKRKNASSVIRNVRAQRRGERETLAGAGRRADAELALCDVAAIQAPHAAGVVRHGGRTRRFCGWGEELYFIE